MPTPAPIDQTIWRRHAILNAVQSIALLAAMAGYLALLGWLLWGPAGLWWLLLLGALSVLFNPAVAPAMVMRFYRASPILPQHNPQLLRTTAVLAARAKLPRPPAVYYVPSRMLNAFAVGSPTKAAIGLTDGLLRNLTGRELTAVLAHEMSHVRSNDLWVMGLADLFSRLTSTLSLVGQILFLLNLPLLLLGMTQFNWLAVALLIFAPSLSALTQLALSRTREYDADLNAVALTGDPEGLASALHKLEQLQGGWLERIFAPGRRIPDPSLLRSHPHTAQRIQRLRALRPATYQQAPLPSLRGLRPPGPTRRQPGWHISGLWY